MTVSTTVSPLLLCHVLYNIYGIDRETPFDISSIVSLICIAIYSIKTPVTASFYMLASQTINNCIGASMHNVY